MRKVIPVLIALSLFGCGGSESEPTKAQETITKDIGVPAAMSSMTILDGANVVAYVVGFDSDNTILVYLPNEDKYATINQATGAYGGGHSHAYFAGLNCTGAAYVTSSFLGVNGKTVFAKNGNYYLVSGTRQTGIATQSYMDDSGCTNATFTPNAVYPLTGATQPRDFSPLAPITIQYD